MKKATKVTLVFMAVMTVIGSKALIDYSKEASAIKKQEQKVQAEMQAQQDRKIELDGTVDVYSSRSAVEEIARKTLGLVKPGEKFYKNYNNNQ